MTADGLPLNTTNQAFLFNSNTLLKTVEHKKVSNSRGRPTLYSFRQVQKRTLLKKKISNPHRQ